MNSKANSNGGFDLEAFMAAAQKVAMAAEAKAQAQKPDSTRERQRAVWPDQTLQIASAAGIRLPGLYPLRNCQGWQQNPPRHAKVGAPGRAGDTARQLLWQLAASQIAESGSVPVVQVVAALLFIRQQFEAENAKAPNWTLYLTPQHQKDGHGPGAYTCALHQISLMVGSVILTTETVTKAV